MINFYNENVKKPTLDYRSIKTWVRSVVESFNLSVGDLSIIFCSDSFILEYNIKYLQHNYFTDIITFNYNNSSKISGDLFLSIDTIRRNAIDYCVKDEEEFLRVIIHGVLHLIGFNDQTEEEIVAMREQESKALQLYHSGIK